MEENIIIPIFGSCNFKLNKPTKNLIFTVGSKNSARMLSAMGP